MDPASAVSGFEVSMAATIPIATRPVAEKMIFIAIPLFREVIGLVSDVSFELVSISAITSILGVKDVSLSELLYIDL